MSPLDRLKRVEKNLLDQDEFDHAREIARAIDELHVQQTPSNSPFDPPAPETSSHYKAWAAICEVMREIGGSSWSSAASCPREAAVAAIRSMAAQCSAQPAADERPASTPPLGAIWVDALGYAAGFLHAHDRVAIARELRALGSWLVANAPQE